MPTTAAAVLRVFFHDCMIDGCDGSTLVASNAFNPKAERDAEINLSLPGDAFDLITRIKTDLKLHCPGIVSCTDILATSTRNLVKMTGGPFYEIKLGRKDRLVSQVLKRERYTPNRGKRHATRRRHEQRIEVPARGSEDRGTH
ncbi:hypothetical protein RND81_07G190200 [Saponaria officinalis]|uniref:peroxidase n=1 Tax=Saponaria officinalis TaxID=3572 RepID=A0AAW1JV42_SAPOF